MRLTGKSHDKQKDNSENKALKLAHRQAVSFE
jgi:hypothetical protein